MKSTKQKILESAFELFIEKGFSGTSISDIASKAGVNQSLIYHHIGNKEDLWKEVKKSLIAFQECSLIKHDNFEDFINYILRQRIEIYEKEPKLVRLLQWQNLEDNSTLLANSYASPISWVEIIKNFQVKGEVINSYKAELITVYIHSLTNALIFDYFKIFANDKNLKEEYIAFIQRSINKLFKVIK